MAKKETKKKITSVPLFDDSGTDSVSAKKKSSASVKSANKPSKGAKESTSVVSKKTTNKSTKPKKESKDDKRNHISDDSGVRTNTDNRRNNNKKDKPKPTKDKVTRTSKKSGAADVKSTKSSKSAVKDRTSSTKSIGKTKSSSVKNTKSKSTDSAGKQPKDKDTTTRKHSARTKSNERAAFEGIEQMRKDYKKSKRKQERTSRINPPKTIIWGPYPFDSDEFIDEIVLDGGEYRQVSAWSVKNNQYHEGLDSEFIINRLSYPQKIDDENNSTNALKSFNKKMKTKYDNWQDASYHKNMKEAVIDEFADYLDWLVLLANNDMDNCSTKFKKKYKQKYALRCLL